MSKLLIEDITKVLVEGVHSNHAKTLSDKEIINHLKAHAHPTDKNSDHWADRKSAILKEFNKRHKSGKSPEISKVHDEVIKFHSESPSPYVRKTVSGFSSSTVSKPEPKKSEKTKEDNSGVSIKHLHFGSHPDFPDSSEATDVYHNGNHIGSVVTKAISGTTIPGGFGSGYQPRKQYKTTTYEKKPGSPHGKSGGYSEIKSDSDPGMDWHPGHVESYKKRIAHNVKTKNRASYW